MGGFVIHSGRLDAAMKHKGVIPSTNAKIDSFYTVSLFEQKFGASQETNLNVKKAVELCFESDKQQFLKRLRTFCSLCNQNRKVSLAPK
jgi:hypothetical protein